MESRNKSKMPLGSYLTLRPIASLHHRTLYCPHLSYSPYIPMAIIHPDRLRGIAFHPPAVIYITPKLYFHWLPVMDGIVQILVLFQYNSLLHIFLPPFGYYEEDTAQAGCVMVRHKIVKIKVDMIALLRAKIIHKKDNPPLKEQTGSFTS